MEWISYGLLIVILGYLIGLGISILVRKRKQVQEVGVGSEQPAAPAKLEVVGVTVQSKEMTEESPDNSQSSVFTVVFVTDAGEQKPLQVTEDVFAALQEGDVGALALQNGQYYDFQKADVQNQE